MPRPQRKPKEFSGRSQQVRALVLTTKWNNMVEINDHRGKPFRRFYQLDTLSSGVDRLIHDRDRLFQPSVEKLIGPGRLTTLSFTLVGEDELRLLFSVKVVAGTRRTALNFVVAKNPEEASRRVALEYKHLRILHETLGDDMAEPLRAGIIFLPDRHRREDHHRELESYLTAQPSGFEPLGIHRNEQYTAGGVPPHTFSKRETEQLKVKMVQLVMKAYHPVNKTGIDTGQLDPSTFQVNRTGKGVPRLKLFNCVHMQTRLTPMRVMGFLLTDSWTCRGMESPVAPDEPAMFFEGIVNAVGKDIATEWLTQYFRLATAGKVKRPHPEYLAALGALV